MRIFSVFATKLFQFLQKNEKSKIFCEYEMDLHVIRNEVQSFRLDIFIESQHIRICFGFFTHII